MNNWEILAGFERDAARDKIVRRTAVRAAIHNPLTWDPRRRRGNARRYKLRLPRGAIHKLLTRTPARGVARITSAAFELPKRLHW